MVVPRQIDCEQNEVRWWSSWARVRWFGRSAWLLMSDRFPEYFMNRGGFLDCEAGSQRFRDIEVEMVKRGRAPHFFVQESCTKTARLMLDSGYRVVDSMAIMSPGLVRMRKNPEVKVEVASGEGLVGWSKAYLQSFYGSLELLPAATDVVRSLRRLEQATLMVGRVNNRVAGVLALFRTRGLLGVYCVGTVPQFRKRGVALTMLETAHGISKSENRQAILQTILSDGYEPYYIKRGFKRLYLKKLLRKPLAHSGQNRAA